VIGEAVRVCSLEYVGWFVGLIVVFFFFFFFFFFWVVAVEIEERWGEGVRRSFWTRYFS
jgi:hypothetical protein